MPTRDKTSSPSRTPDIGNRTPKTESTDIVEEEALNQLSESKYPLEPRAPVAPVSFDIWPGKQSSPLRGPLPFGFGADFPSTSQTQPEPLWFADAERAFQPSSIHLDTIITTPLLSPIKLSPKPETDMNLASDAPAPMTEQRTDTSSGRKKMNLPKEFSGKRDEFKQWFLSCRMYIAGNHKIYPTDFDKINFILSFMNSGEAAAWNEQYIDDQPDIEDMNLGNWDDFKKDPSRLTMHPETREKN